MISGKILHRIKDRKVAKLEGMYLEGEKLKAEGKKKGRPKGSKNKPKGA